LIGSKPKRFGDTLGDQLNNPFHGLFGIRGWHEVEISVSLWRGEIGHAARVDGMGRGDDFALRGLAEHFR